MVYKSGLSMPRRNIHRVATRNGSEPERGERLAQLDCESKVESIAARDLATARGRAHRSGNE
jgi:hypothetical protein